jgi:hypothetical protein
VPEGPLIIRSDGSQAPGRTVRASEWTLTLAPSALTYIRIDHQARLQFEHVEVIIENVFSLEIGEKHFNLDPGDRAGLGPLLSLYPSNLATASLDADGTLHLSFDPAGTIAVPPHPATTSSTDGGVTSVRIERGGVASTAGLRAISPHRRACSR